MFLQLLSLALAISGIWNRAGRNWYNGVAYGYGYGDGGYLYRSICDLRAMMVDMKNTVNGQESTDNTVPPI